jgi:hypothetical protein
MAKLPIQRLLPIALAAVFGVLSAIPRNGSQTLHLATGDHLHVSLSESASHHHDHDSDSTDGYDLEHKHVVGDVESKLTESDVHRHDCIVFSLPSGDYRSSMSSACYDTLQGWDAVPPVPICVLSPLLAVSLHPESSRPPGAFGLTPPQLVRSTIFLI